jgi:formylglycine-generating enzyme required for sulfatase activity
MDGLIFGRYPASPFKGVVIVTISAALVLGSVVLLDNVPMPRWSGEHVVVVSPPETVAVAPATLSYRAAGEFLLDGISVDAPLVDFGFPVGVHVMKYQVTVADYERCVDAGACAPADARKVSGGRVPVTGVSFIDAQRYAKWLSAQTGQVWRLPTDQEWVLAAGSRFADDALGLGPDARNPSKRWIAEYQRNAELDVEFDGQPKPSGYFDENEYGIADLSGNVWEWTSSCFVRATVSRVGSVDKVLTTNCGVRVVEGRHRTYMTDFVRDAKSGGCAVGTPPDNLGFRLVRQHERGLFRFAHLIGVLNENP